VLDGQGASKNFGCVWFDAHDDYNIPDTVLSGYLDSQALALLAGECWKGMLKTVPGHESIKLQLKRVSCVSVCVM
jgi:arginase family enzyme